MRDWHLSAGIPWERMAVIAHDTRQVTALETELAAREIPTRAAGVQRPLGSEGIVRDIVGIVRLALTPDEDRTVQAWEEALRTPFGGMDAIALRRLRARLRHLELGQGGSTPARELLRAAMSAPATLTLIDAPESRTAERFAETVAGVARAAAEGETIHDLLWRIWEQARAVDGRRLQVAWRRSRCCRPEPRRRDPWMLSWLCSTRPSASSSAHPTSAPRSSWRHPRQRGAGGHAVVPDRPGTVTLSRRPPRSARSSTRWSSPVCRTASGPTYGCVAGCSRPGGSPTR